MQNFTSTRDDKAQASFTHAILNPNAPNKGLWAIREIPKIDFQDLKSLNYHDLSQNISQALKLDITQNMLALALQSYQNFDDPKNPAPLKKISSNLSILELYHGNTRAFKDMALAPFGSLFSQIAQKNNQKFLLLTATSGDTGPATLDSFSNQENIQVVCLYPKGGTSDIQELQMITQNAPNLHIFGIKGNFDDAQSLLKSLIHNIDFTQKLKDKSLQLSVANSINFGRIFFQIIYHIWGYFSYIKTSNLPYGTPITPIIPSGNFGNALGAFYAKKMGLPFDKIIIASNPNNILTDFIHTGIYDISHRKLIRTYSPAMDILKSSNVERVLFSLFGAQRTKQLQESLEKQQSYQLDSSELKTLQEHFEAVFCPDLECLNLIKEYADQSILIDPHTANGIYAFQMLKQEKKHYLVCSTAEWCKFAPTITFALEGKKMSDFQAIEKITKDFHLTLHHKISVLLKAPVYHQEVLETQKVQEKILSLL